MGRAIRDRFSKTPLVWQDPDGNDPAKFDERLRIVMGLAWLDQKLTTIASITCRPTAECATFLKGMWASTHVTVQDCLEHGLPRNAVVAIPTSLNVAKGPPITVYCYRCNSTLSSIPCPKCARPGKPATERGKVAGERLAEQPTTAIPGSAEKVAVMKARGLRGESLFHPGDTVVPVCYTGGYLSLSNTFSLEGIREEYMQTQGGRSCP